MISRDDALKFIEEKIPNRNIIKHMIALEKCMGALALKFGGVKEEWEMAGLLHDGDYSPEVPVEKQGVLITEWLREKGYDIPENVSYAMAAHNWHGTGCEPKTPMDWSIFCADSLTGLIVACALVLPSKKLEDVTLERVLKKFGNKSFAGGTRREEIAMCGEKLGISLEDFIGICLKSMQDNHEELGL